jgi:hypothetical protein
VVTAVTDGSGRDGAHWGELTEISPSDESLSWAQLSASLQQQPPTHFSLRLPVHRVDSLVNEMYFFLLSAPVVTWEDSAVAADPLKSMVPLSLDTHLFQTPEYISPIRSSRKLLRTY